MANLPSELIRHILSYINHQPTLSNLALTCSIWSLISLEQLYRAPRLDTQLDVLLFLGSLTPRNSCLVHEFDFSRHEVPAYIDNTFISSLFTNLPFPRLNRIKLQGSVNDNGVHTMLSHIGHTLLSLNIISHCLTRECLITISKFCPNLRQFHTFGLEEHNIQYPIHIALSDGCPNLEALSLNGCMGVDDHVLMTDIIRMRQLRTLRLTYCLCVSDTGIAALAQQLPELEHLSLDGIINITEHSLIPLIQSCLRLKTLTLCTAGVSFSVLETIRLRLSQLETLSLRLGDGETEFKIEMIEKKLPNVKIVLLDGFEDSFEG